MLRHVKRSHEVTEVTDVPVVNWKPNDSSAITKSPAELALEDMSRAIKQKRLQVSKAMAAAKSVRKPKAFICVTCGKKFPTEGILNQHVKFHEYSPEHNCPICGEQQLNEFMLIRHMKNHENRPVPCSLCPKAYFTANALHAHERKVHGRMKNILYLCRLCSKVFQMQKELVAHEKEHDVEEGLAVLDEDLPGTAEGDEAELKCKHCAKVCVSIHALKGHLKRFHGRLRVIQYGCKLCSATFRNIKDFLVHEEKHLKRRIEGGEEDQPRPKKKVVKVSAPHDLFYCKCKECPKICHTKGGLYSHVQNHHDGTQVLHFTCRVCLVLYEFRQDMTKHVTQEHREWIENCSHSYYSDEGQDYEEDFEEDFEGSENNDLYPENDNLGTVYRGMGLFANEDSRVRTESQEGSFEESESGESDGYEGSEGDVSEGYDDTIQGENLHRVESPGDFHHKNANTLEKDMLGKRVDRPSRDLPFKCDFCQRAFRKKYSLFTHQAEVHYGEGMYKCQYCPRQFVSKSRYNIHLNHHESHRLFKCKECPRGFASEKALENHQQEHNGLKPIKCGTCDRGFSSKHRLQMHEKRMHTTVERNHPCKHCQKRFPSQWELAMHEKRHLGHRPFECPTCGKAFTAKYSMQLHIKAVHTKEKGLMCKICGRKFSLDGNLYEHMVRCKLKKDQQAQV